MASNIMNKISKYLLFLRQMNLFSLNVLRQQQNVQSHVFSTKSFPMFHYTSYIQMKRFASYTNQSGLTNLVDNSDILLTSIKTAKETRDVLEMLRLHNSVISAPHALQALSSIFLLQKNKLTKLSNEELTRSPEFTALCVKILNFSRNFELNDVMNCVKYLCYLEVSVNSNIMQIMLQLISKMMNDLSLNQITFLHFLLKELTSCPLVDALKLALPIVFETQVQYKLEDNVYWQLEFLNYITKHKLSQETFDFVMSRIIRNFGQLNPKMIKSLLLCLYYKDYSTEKYINTINKCLQIYKNRIEFIADFSDIEAILSRMINKYLLESEIFYNEEFINTILSYIIKKQERFENIGYIIKKLNRIGYVHRELLDYLTNQLTEDSTILENMKFGMLLSYIAACANANYVPPGFDELKPQILKRFNMQKDVLELPWLLVAFDLAVLDCWSEELLERVFSKNFLSGFLKRSGNIQDYIMLLKLYQATMTLYPGGYQGTLPSSEFIDKAIEIYQQNVEDFPLKACLEQGLGGNDYVLTGIRSKMGHFIDHLVVMRPGGYSVSIKNETKGDKSNILVENIIGSNDNLVIGILLFRPNAYVINLKCLRGPYALTNKTIEALGVSLLPISMEVWNELIDYEKIPYIMRELKSKADLKLTTETNFAH